MRARAGIFTLEYLKEALNNIKQIAASETGICIRAHTGEEISVEELYEKYHAYSISEIDAAISPSTKTTPMAKTGEKIEGKEEPNKTPLNPMKTGNKTSDTVIDEPTEKERKNLQEELSRVYGLVFDWRDGLHTDKVASELGIDRSEALKLLHILERDGMISQVEGKEGWWKA